MCELRLGIPMYPTYPIGNEHLHDIYIINDMIHTHISQKITRFIRNQCEYKIFSDAYVESRSPLLHVTIHEDEINIKLSTLYNVNITKKDKIEYILSKLEHAYNNYKQYIMNNRHGAEMELNYVVEEPPYKILF